MIRRTGFNLVFLLIFTLAAGPLLGQQQTLAYWAQNDNALPGGGFGFTPDSFPQPADVGAGFIVLRDFDASLDASGAYAFIQSFGGTAENALPGFASGGSLAPQGGAGTANNGMSIEILVDTTGFENIRVSWAQRGTSTGFASRRFAWSAESATFTEFAVDDGTLGSSWQTRSHDLSSVDALADNPLAVFRITLDGATGASGNNRFDNILVEGTEIGAPERFPLLAADFTSDPFGQGWRDINVAGDQRWQWSSTFANVSFSPFVGGCQVNENWLVTPAIDFDAQDGERLQFSIARGFPGDNDLEVLFSTDWDGIGDPNGAAWTPIATIASGDFDSNNSPLPFGPFEALAGAAGTGFVAFRFVYETGGCATWRVESFELLAEGAGDDPVAFACGNEAIPIHAVQGPGFSSPLQGQPVQLEAIVTGAFLSSANGGLGGFFVQQADADRDDDPLTSEGIFVFDGGFGVPVERGDRVRVAGTVAEFFNETQLADITDVAVCDTGRLADTQPATLALPFADTAVQEALEGMWVVSDQPLTVTDVFNAVRFGEIEVSAGRRFEPTQVAAPGAGAQQAQAENDLNRIIIDDARNGSNRTPLIPGGDNVTALAADNPIRNGYIVEAGLEGLVGFAFDRYRVHPLARPEFDPDGNPRPDTPERMGEQTLRAASFNVGNLFSTLDQPGTACGPNLLGCRGARTESERDRQFAKTATAIRALDADLVALIEVENDADDATLQRLIDELNAGAAIGDWNFVTSGFVGTDAIKPAFIYRELAVRPEGPLARLDASVDPRFDTSRQRPALAQAFRVFNSGVFNAVAVHLRSKGSCPAPGDPNADQGDGQGCWNPWRTLSAEALADWIASDPTGAGDPDWLVLGDFNAYGREDPLFVLAEAGFENLAPAFNGGDPAVYSFVFRGQAGALDHALASPALAEQVIDARYWPINADEIPAFDFTEGTLPGGFLEKPENFFDPGPYRSSDHDPLLIELDLDACAPGLVRRPVHPDARPLPLPDC
ncbi:MAG: ExeM/NucH family extracellular endonuclease [Wenzhouxiangellaceae bacterium]|nr:ExeM/NucH family extracellular endonuclease [Wenzhouxiangellaceae bacterium]